MSQRINISVSDDLYQKIQAFRDRLPISRLCQEILARAVAIEELRSQAAKDIDRLAIVFKQEREACGQNFREEGFRDGMKDAFKTDYHSMCDLWMRSEAGDHPEELFNLGASRDTSEKVESNNVGIDEDGVFLDHFSLPFDEFSNFYYAGWVAGFLDVWERVCTKLSIHGFTKVEEAPHGDEQP
jgi:hypothetical protein